jgi:hypothetical protein
MEWDFFFGQKFVANYGLFIDFEHIVDDEYDKTSSYIAQVYM